MEGMQWWQSGLAVLCGLIACVTDLKSRKIPNWLTFSVMVIGIVGVIGLEPVNWKTPLLGLGTGLGLLVVPFMLGGMGAGDLKLLMALGALLGPVRIFWVFLFAGVAGGLLALGYMIYRMGICQAVWRTGLMAQALWSGPRREVLRKTNETGQLSIPYGVAVLAGLILEIALHGM